MTTSRASGHRPENLRSLPPGSPAKTSPRPGSRKGCQPKEADCSTKSSVWLGNFDLNSCCLKMLEIFYPTKTGRRSKKCSSKLPKQGLMLNGHLFQLQIWEPAINEKECGSLPTPRANRAMTVDLTTQQNRPELQPNLETVMARMLPTPVANDSNNRRAPYRQGGTPLLGRLLPTPTTRDHKDGNQFSCQNTPSNGLLGREIHKCYPPTGEPMYLNPFFVEEMMGYPVGWTA